MAQSRQPPIGAVLCGGRSARFGSDKALAPAGDRLVGERVVDALRAGGVDPVMAVGGTAGPRLALPTVPDLRPGGGPLGGLATALLWARTGRVVVAACDLVLLQADDVTALVSASAESGTRPVVATVNGEPAPCLSCWPADHGRRVLKLFDGGRRAFRAALDGVDWVGVAVDPTSLADADTPEELDRLLAGRSGDRP